MDHDHDEDLTFWISSIFDALVQHQDALLEEISKQKGSCCRMMKTIFDARLGAEMDDYRKKKDKYIEWRLKLTMKMQKREQRLAEMESRLTEINQRMQQTLMNNRKATEEIEEQKKMKEDLSDLLTESQRNCADLSVAHKTVELEVQSLKRKIVLLEGRQDPPKVECIICKRRYDNIRVPLVGTCGHSICRFCRPRLDRSKDCPICRHPWSFFKRSDNFLAKEILSHFHVGGTDDDMILSSEGEEEEGSVAGADDPENWVAEEADGVDEDLNVDYVDGDENPAGLDETNHAGDEEREDEVMIEDQEEEGNENGYANDDED